MRKMLTQKNSPEYVTVKECQAVCRFKGPEPIRRAVYRGELIAIRVRANRLLILASSFWQWFHQHDLSLKPKKEEFKDIARRLQSRERTLMHQLDYTLHKLQELQYLES